MDDAIKGLCRQLNKIVSEHSDCWSCGTVIQDPELLVPDPINPGRFFSLCPSCDKETMKFPFPPRELGPVFGMMTESAERKQPILAVILACTIYEALMEGFFVRLMERHHIDWDIVAVVTDEINYQAKIKITKGITGKSLGDLMKSAGYEGILATHSKIQKKRNLFLHRGMAIKEKNQVPQNGQHGYSHTEIVELDEKDIKQSLQFTIDIIKCFAQLYTIYGKYVEVDYQDY